MGLIARNPEALEAAKEECEQLGGQAVCLQTDVSDADAVEAAASKLEETFGPIVVWVNDAMVSVFLPVKEMEPSDYKRVTNVLDLGFVHGTLAALKRMLPRDRGTIIQIGSTLSSRSIPLQSAYCACKHAINGFTDSLRCGLYHDRRNVKHPNIQMPAMNAIQFDWVKNRMADMTQPVPPIFEPEVAAEVVYVAGVAKNPRRGYWVGTPTVAAIIGQKFIPGLLDKYLGATGYQSQQLKSTPQLPTTPNTLCEYVPCKSQCTRQVCRSFALHECRGICFGQSGLVCARLGRCGGHRRLPGQAAVVSRHVPLSLEGPFASTLGASASAT